LSIYKMLKKSCSRQLWERRLR